MNRDTVIALAREAGLMEIFQDYSYEFGSGDAEQDCMPELERFAALVAAHIREECAQVCDEMNKLDAGETVRDAAAAIRSRT